MCRSTSITWPLDSFARSSGFPVVVVPAAGHLRVDAFELVGDPRPRELGPQWSGRVPQAVAQAGVGDQALELAGQRVGVSRLEEQAPLALGEDLLVDREAGRQGNGAGGQRPQQEIRGGSLAIRCADEDLSAGEQLIPVDVVRRGEADPVAEARPQLDLGRAAPRAEHRRPPAGVRVEAAERPQEEAQGAALLLGEEHDMDGSIRG